MPGLSCLTMCPLKAANHQRKPLLLNLSGPIEVYFHMLTYPHIDLPVSHCSCAGFFLPRIVQELPSFAKVLCLDSCAKFTLYCVLFDFVCSRSRSQIAVCVDFFFDLNAEKTCKSVRKETHICPAEPKATRQMEHKTPNSRERISLFFEN